MASRAQHITLPSWTYKAMLLLAAAIWGMGTVVIKGTVDAFPPAWLVAIRFFSAGLILGIILLPRMIRTFDASHWATGAFLGVLLAFSYCLNTTGLTDTTASKSSFLTGTYCVFVPFISWAVSRQRPTRFNLAAAMLCILGIWFVSQQHGGEGFSMGFGDAITLLSSVFLALHLAFVARFADGRDMVALTVIQFLVCGILAGLWAAATEAPPTPDMFTPETVSNIAYLVLLGSCAALMLQNVGLTRVPAAPGSLLLATESVFGVTFSILLLGDVMTARLVLGFGLIAAGIVVSEALPQLSGKWPWSARSNGTR